MEKRKWPSVIVVQRSLARVKQGYLIHVQTELLNFSYSLRNSSSAYTVYQFRHLLIIKSIYLIIYWKLSFLCDHSLNCWMCLWGYQRFGGMCRHCICLSMFPRDDKILSILMPKAKRNIQHWIVWVKSTGTLTVDMNVKKGLPSLDFRVIIIFVSCRLCWNNSGSSLWYN